MHPPEHFRVEAGLKLIKRPVVRHPGDLPRHYVNRLVGQGGIEDLFGLHEEKPVSDLDSHLIPPDLAIRHHFDDSLELVVHRVAGAGVCDRVRPARDRGL